MKNIALAKLTAATPALAEPRITLAPPRTLAWETTAEGVAFAALSGDRLSEPFFAMVRLPAGAASPLHFETAAMSGVVIEGRMTHAGPQQDGAFDFNPVQP